MVRILKLLTDLVNNFHDILILIFKIFGLNLTDKELHFWIIGIIGIFIFLVTNSLFKQISKWSILAISFIYTFTVLIVLVFGLEIEQRITNRGNMEFKDIIAGLWGFLAFFALYLFVRLVIYLTLLLYKKYRKSA